MTRGDFVKLLGEIEKNIPVAEWKYGDMHIWPIIKKDVFLHWVDNQVVKEGERHTLIQRKSVLAKSVLIFKSIVKYISLALMPAKKVDALFAGAATYRADIGDTFINKFFYPIFLKNKSGKYLELEYGKIVPHKNYGNSMPIIFFINLLPVFRFFRKFKTKPSLIVPGWDSFVSIMNDANVVIKKNLVLKKLDSVLAMADAFQLILKKYQPRKIYELCYYKNEMFALNFVANRSNIVCYDIQHGGQGPLHVMYTFINVPKEGFNTLPKIFWTWDAASSNHIKSWSQFQTYHQVEENKNPWVEYQLENYNADILLDERKIILYTLQEAKLDDYIIETIKNTPAEYIWWLRLHPRKLHAKENIISQLKSVSESIVVEIEKATTLPLPVLLKKSSVHISKYSGSIIEAAQIGTPTIIIDRIGEENFKNYIENGNAVSVLSGNSTELNAAILKINRDN